MTAAKEDHMHCRLGLVLVAVVLPLLALPGPARAGGSPGQICAGAKLKAASKSARSSLVCHARAARDGISADATCLAKAAAKLGDAFARSETRGGCVTAGDASSVQASLDSNVDALVAQLRPVADANRCAEAKLKATGKKAQTKLGCQAKAAGVGVAVDPVCLARAEERFVTAFSKADAKPPCLTSADAGGVEDLVDDLVADVVAAIPSASTTTTTTSTTSTTVTTTTIRQCVPFSLACDQTFPDCTCGEPGCPCVDAGRSFCIIAPDGCNACPAGFACVPCVICLLHSEITGATGDSCVLPCD